MRRGFAKQALLASMGFVMSLSAGIATAQEDTRIQPPFDFPFLEPDEPYAGTFSENVSGWLHGFYGEEGDVITLSLDGDQDSYLVLFGEEGQFLTHNDDGPTGIGASLVEDFELPYTGTYYALATLYSRIDGFNTDPLSGPANYEILVSGNTTPPRETRYPRILTTELTSGEVYAGELTAEFPVGYFSFEIFEGEQMDIVFDYDKFVSYPMLYVFDSTGARLAVSPSMDRSSEADFPNYIAPEYEIYFVMALDTFFMDIDEESGDYGLGTFTISLELNEPVLNGSDSVIDGSKDN